MIFNFTGVVLAEMYVSRVGIGRVYAVPLVVLYPLMAAWFGIGSESKIAFASVYGMIPATLATAAGIQGMDPQLSLTAKSMGATLWQRIVHVIIHAAIPSILSGLRIGGALAIVGVVVAQMLVSTAGLGFVITTYRTLLDGPHVFAAILCVPVIAIAFDWLVRLLESVPRRGALEICFIRRQNFPCVAHLLTLK